MDQLFPLHRPNLLSSCWRYILFLLLTLFISAESRATCNLTAAWTYTVHGDTVVFTTSDTNTAAHHFWTYGDGSTTGSGFTVTHVYPNYGTYHVCLNDYIPNITGCTDSFCQNIYLTQVNPCASLTAAWTYTSITGDSVQFHAVDTSTAAHIYWSFGDGNTGTGIDPRHNYTASGTYHVCLYIYIPGTTCVDSFCSTISIGAPCVTNAAWTSYTHGDTVFFTAADTNTTVHLDWNAGDGNYIFGKTPIHVYSQPGTYHVCLYAYIPGTTCEDSFCNNITVGSGCHVNASWSYTVSGDTVHFVGVDTNTSAHHIFNFGDGTYSTAGVNVTHIYSAPGTYHVCFYVYEPNTNCSDSSCNNVTITSTCNVNAAWQYYTGGTDSAHFYAADTASNVTFYWHFGDGTIGTGRYPWHGYANPGTYHVCLYAYTGSNCIDSFCNTVTIGSGCNITATWSYTAAGDSVSFTSSGSNTTAHYYWNFGDGTTASGYSPSHTYAGPGTYHVCQYVYIPNTNCSDSSCNTIVVTNGCNINAAWQSYSIDDSVHFYVGDTSSAIHRYWNFGDGSNYGTGTDPWHYYTQPGTYNVCLYAYIPGIAGCTDSFCSTVTVGNGCHVTATWSYTVSGDTVSFVGVDTNSAAHHIFNFGDGTYSTSGVNVTHVYSAPGTYHVCFYVYVPNTSCSDSSCNNITLVNTCNVNAAWQYYTGGTDSAHFYAADTASNVTYYWHFGDGTIGTGRDPWHGYSQPGTYYACLYAYISGTNCLDSFCNTVIIGSGCNITATWTYTAVGDSVHFTSSGSNTTAHYYWNFGDGTTASGYSPSHTYAGPGTYHVCHYVYIPNTNCSDSSCNTIVVTSGCNLNATWQSYSIGDSVHFYVSDTSSAIHRYWNFGDGSSYGTGTNPWHTYSQPGTYNVCLYAYIPGITGCVDTFCSTVTVGNGCTINAAWQYYTGGTDSAHFYAADTASNVTFYWHFGDGTIGSGRYPWHGYSQPGTYHVCLYVYISGTNCLDSSCNNITIVSPCNLNAAWQYYTIGDSAHFYAADTSTSANYYWHFGDGTTGTGRLPWHHYTQPGTYYACLYVSNTALNCLDSFCSTVVIGSGCTVNSSWSYTVSGDTVRFVGADTNTAAHHIYNFGDGTYSTSGVNVTHVYSGPGTYHVCFYVYIPGSTCSDSTCNDIIIDSSCNVNAAWQYYAYGTDSAHFYASNTVGNVSYYWHFGDGTVGTGSNPWHGYSQPGTYHVCLYASIGTNCTDSFCSTVIIGSGCNINASWSYTLHGDTVYLVSTDTSSANHHIWIFDYNTSTVTSGTSITHVFTGAGTYHVCLYVYTPGTTCSDSSCNNVTIVDSCVTDAAWISVIHGDSVYFYATDTNSTVHYDWNAGDGNYVFGTHPVHVYAGPGTYHVCLYAYVGNCLDSFCNTITVGSGCNITSAWTYTASGDSVSFTTANTNTASHHYWNFGDGTGTSAFNVSHTYTAPGTYHVCYYVYLPNTNCFDSTCNDITITGGCNLTAAWNFLHTNGDTFHFYALIPDSNVYILWTFGDGTTSSGSYVIHTYPQPGTYEVCVHAYIPGTPCSDSLCISVTFGDSCAVTAAWTSISHPNDSVQFYALDPDTTAHHYWTFGDGGSASGSYATHTYAQSGTYNVCLYVYIPGTTCSDSLCQNVNSILGVTDIGSYPTITLSPNPFSQYAVMNISGPASVYEVHIYDMTGRMIRIDHSANNSIMIERGGLSSGIYLYEVQAGDMIIGKGKMSVE